MDRFIVQNFQKRKETKTNLKSNMDRFIDTTAILNDFSKKFKIQYG